MSCAKIFFYIFCTSAFLITGVWTSNATTESQKKPETTSSKPTVPNNADQGGGGGGDGPTKCLVCSSNPTHANLFDQECGNPSPEFLNTSTKIIDCSQYRSRIPQGGSGYSTECPSVRLTRCGSIYYETYSVFKSMDSKTYDWSGSKSLVFRFCACASPDLEQKIQESGPDKRYCSTLRGTKATSRTCICQPKSSDRACNGGGQVELGLVVFQVLLTISLLIPHVLTLAN